MFVSEEQGWWIGEDSTKPIFEGRVSVENFTDSTVRYVRESSGMTQQIINNEPLGCPRISLHQNHYSAYMIPQTTLGCIDFGIKDQVGASISAFTDGEWKKDSRPGGLSFNVSGDDKVRPAVTLTSDGRMAIGEEKAGNSLVSLGVYRNGVFQLPKVERLDDLIKEDPVPDGCMVYCKEEARILVSHDGEWHSIVTTPVRASPNTVARTRQIGSPRKDGKPPVFGPRPSRRWKS